MTCLDSASSLRGEGKVEGGDGGEGRRGERKRRFNACCECVVSVCVYV